MRCVTSRSTFEQPPGNCRGSAGHGLASPFDYRRVELWRHAVAFLTEVVDALALEKVDVAANSMGGLWAIAFAAARPERVRHLVLSALDRKFVHVFRLLTPQL